MFTKINEQTHKELQDKVDLTELPVAGDIQRRIDVVVRHPAALMGMVSEMIHIDCNYLGGLYYVTLRGAFSQSEYRAILDYCLDFMGGVVRGLYVTTPQAEADNHVRNFPPPTSPEAVAQGVRPETIRAFAEEFSPPIAGFPDTHLPWTYRYPLATCTPGRAPITMRTGFKV